MSEPSSFTDAANAEGLEQLVTGKPKVAPEVPRKSSRKIKAEAEEVASEYHADAKPGMFVPKRRWHCMGRHQGCKGRVAFTGWEQLEKRPQCPLCQGEMEWNQWMVRA